MRLYLSSLPRISPIRYRLLSFSLSSFSSVSSEKRGVFGVSHFVKAEDFPSFARKTEANCLKTRDKIKNDLLNSSPKTVLEHLDSISREICSAIDVAELCRNVHSEESYRRAADEAFTIVSGLIHKLNSDSTLYDSLTRAILNGQTQNSLTQEDLDFALDLKHEFESDGVHLSSIDKEKLVLLQAKMVDSESNYIRNIGDNETNFEFVVEVDDESEIDCQMIRDWLKANGVSQAAVNPNSFKTNIRLARSLLGSLPDSRIRKSLWIGIRNSNIPNIEGLGELIISRQNVARILGFKSYAHKYLSNKVFKSPEKVIEFINGISKSIMVEAESEFKALSASVGFKPKIWDLSYIMNPNNRPVGNDENRVSQIQAFSAYLPIEKCLESLNLICNKLYGVTVTKTEFDQGENWSELYATNGREKLYKFLIIRNSESVLNSSEDVVGVIYVDPFARANKFSGSAHFNIQSGCSNLSPGSQQNTKRQIPIVAIVLNFSNSFENNAAKTPFLLSFSELQTLYHEWGHAMHSVLSQTHYQHLAGTRGPLDIAEIPSHLFEYFARDGRVLSQWARHYETNKAAPAELLDAVTNFSNPTGAMELQQQLFLSSVDQVIFGNTSTDIPLNPLESYDIAARETYDLHNSMLRDSYPVAFTEKNNKDDDDGGHLLLRDSSLLHLRSHNHFVSYGGAYYSYVFSKLCAAQIWKKHLESNPLSRHAGEVIFHGILKLGGGQSAARSVLSEEVLGDKTTLNPSIYLAFKT